MTLDVPKRLYAACLVLGFAFVLGLVVKASPINSPQAQPSNQPEYVSETDAIHALKQEVQAAHEANVELKDRIAALEKQLGSK